MDAIPRDNPLESKDSQNSLADAQIGAKVEHVLKQYVNIFFSRHFHGSNQGRRTTGRLSLVRGLNVIFRASKL